MHNEFDKYFLNENYLEEKQKQSLAKTSNKESALKLRALMCRISEDLYCASWMMGLEYALWDMVLSNKRREYGTGEVTEDEVNQLKQFSKECDGWWIWIDDDKDILNSNDYFITLEEWVKIYSEGFEPYILLIDFNKNTVEKI